MTDSQLERATRRAALARSICARVCDARRSEDELRVIDDVLAGIERGADVIGAMDLANDTRDFDEEAAQECRDLLVYLSMRKVADAHRKREQVERRHDGVLLEFDQIDEGSP